MTTVRWPGIGAGTLPRRIFRDLHRVIARAFLPAIDPQERRLR